MVEWHEELCIHSQYIGIVPLSTPVATVKFKTNIRVTKQNPAMRTPIENAAVTIGHRDGQLTQRELPSESVKSL